MEKGFFITFESIDGLGKTTQMNMLADHFRLAGNREVFCTKEPGDTRMGSNIGAGIRQLVFHDPSTKRMRAGVADLLFLADHIQTAGDVEEAVNGGKLVLCDRYADSQFAYGTSKSKASPPWTIDCFRQNYGIVPDITVLLVARGPDIGWGPPLGEQPHRRPIEDIVWALDRAKGRAGHEQGKQDGKVWNSIDDQRTIQQAYLEQIGPEPRCLRIDVWKNDTREQIHKEILYGVSVRLAHLIQLRVA